MCFSRPLARFTRPPTRFTRPLIPFAELTRRIAGDAFGCNEASGCIAKLRQSPSDLARNLARLPSQFGETTRPLAHLASCVTDVGGRFVHQPGRLADVASGFARLIGSRREETDHFVHLNS
jgi:hypothetical protein